MPQPWWVNLLLLIPLIAAYAWRRNGPELSARQLLAGALFALGFGFVEAAVVVYLRGALGLLGATGAAVPEPAQMNAMLARPEMLRLFRIEVAREAATMLMLASVTVLAAGRARERWAIFLWCFAIWDLMYYAGLWLVIRWPESLLSQDVLFLIPVPWVSAVWFPVLVSGLCVAVVLFASLRGEIRRSQISD